ncbi:MAG: CotH kinase family protein [Flavobacteriales bacterium]
MNKNLLTAFISAAIVSSIHAQNPGDAIWNSVQLIHEIHITFPISNWHQQMLTNHTLEDQTGSAVYLMGTLDFDGVVKDSVGFKFKGNSSFNNPSIKKSWKISTEEFIDSNEVDDENEFNLNNGFKDPSFLREKLCLDFLNHYQVPAPRCDYANVYVNGELFGFYILVEEVDKKFLKTHFGNKGGNLYKGDPHGDLHFAGTSAGPYESNYTKETNSDENDWTDLIWFIDNLNNTPSDQLVDSLDASFNTMEYVKSWATSIMFSQFDSYTGSGHNYFVYHNTATNRFEWINWDVNEAFGSFNFSGSIGNMTTVPIDYVPIAPAQRPLHMKMKDVDVYWDEYRNFMCNTLNDYFNSAHMDYLIDSLHTAISDGVEADPNKLFTFLQFEQNTDQSVGNILGLKPFVSARYDFLQDQLTDFTCTPVEHIETIGSTDMHVFPNPTVDVINVSFSTPIDKIELTDATGRLLLNMSPISTTKLTIDISDVSGGCYILVVHFGESSHTFRVLKN